MSHADLVQPAGGQIACRNDQSANVVTWNLSPKQASTSKNRQEALSLASRTIDRRKERGFRRFTHTESIRVASRDAKFEPPGTNHGIAKAQELTHPVPDLRSRRVVNR